MFEIFNNKKKKEVNAQAIAETLKADRKLINVFEEAYEKASFEQDVERVNAKQAAEIRRQTTKAGVDGEVKEITDRIVDELLAQTEVFSYEPESGKCVLYDKTRVLLEEDILTVADIKKLPKEVQPQLTGFMMTVEMPGSGKAAIDAWQMYMKEKDTQKKAWLYGHFRQGLDLLDIDNTLYSIINRNSNSMGNWLPNIVGAVTAEGYFKIPATKIIKLPLSLLQLTRLEYNNLTPATFEVVNNYCCKAFDLDETKDYFVKTGTYSSKFDFRNARVSGAKEVNELGEYLLYNHWSALQMAHYDVNCSGRPVVYGVSTTVEWVVREFIPDVEENFTIYHGLPLRTEYRVFVDFDTKEVLGIHNYWDEGVLRKHLSSRMWDGDIDAKHDYITFVANKDRLNERYEANKAKVCEHLGKVIQDVDLHGQWSVDIMQNGEDFYIIDMAIAENSAYYAETVAVDKRRVMEEKWLPRIEEKG